MQVQQEAAPEYPARESAIKREAAIVILGILALLAAAFAAWYVIAYRDAPQRVVERFIGAEQTGNVRAARGCVASGANAQPFLDALAEYHRRSGRSLFDRCAVSPHVGSSVRSEHVEIPVAVTLATPSMPSGLPAAVASPYLSSFPLVFELVRQRGAWRIDAPKTLSAMQNATIQVPWAVSGSSAGIRSPLAPPRPPAKRGVRSKAAAHGK